ncbi:MAG: hypothetical protein AB1810_01450 [Pseudomonadota bacterium]
MLKNIFVVISIMIVSGCSTMQPIKYSLDDVSVSSSQLSKVKVKVAPIADSRKSKDQNKVLFTSGNRMSTYKGRDVCLNSEEHYETDKVSSQITEMLIAHLIKKYPDVEIVKGNASPDFEITAEIGDFIAIQDRSMTAAVGAQFGLIGALLTANTTSSGGISISIDNVVIKSQSGEVVSSIGAISKQWKGEFNVDAYCSSPYWNINEKLKIVLEDLVNRVGEEINKRIKST